MPKVQARKRLAAPVSSESESEDSETDDRTSESSEYYSDSSSADSTTSKMDHAPVFRPTVERMLRRREVYQSITRMPEYLKMSVEELRLRYYVQYASDFPALPTSTQHPSFPLQSATFPFSTTTSAGNGVQKERDSLRRQVGQLQLERDAAKRQGAEAAKKLREELDALQAQHATLRRNLALQNNAFAEYKRRTEDAEAKLRVEHDRHLESLRKRIAALEQSKADLATGKAFQRAEIQELRRTIAALLLEKERRDADSHGDGDDSSERARQQQKKRRAEPESDSEREQREREAFERMSGRWDAREKLRKKTPLERYHLQWDQLLSDLASLPSVLLTFEQFPWPLHSPWDITTGSLADFLFVGVERGKRKQTVREQLRRWHPDKFMTRGVLAHVMEKDHARVIELQQEVVICLNQLLQDMQ
ncbi:hypothetical protein EXIGLDRAFT_750772 [Exidia glandulosa HHB12029]|uniref:Uncharacterized protein n=1 Tax=Exidia glandulosa HHB12029 TaxID=1314781 RepID=A0A165G8G9_EXIGL|nr:hypothetical protein EXIGLDRAFT_750772 [Exidia glandulosa HHB12029]